MKNRGVMLSRGYAKALAALIFALALVLAVLVYRKKSARHASDAGIAMVGDQVVVGDSIWTVIEATDMGKSIEATNTRFAGKKKQTMGTFIQIHYQVANNGNRQQPLLDAPKIVDAQGRKFGPIEDESKYVPEGAKPAVLETL